MKRTIWTLRWMALVAAAMAWSTAEESTVSPVPSEPLKSASLRLQNTSLDERLNHSPLKDHLALEVLPYEAAPVYIEPAATSANALRPTDYPSIAKPAHPAPQAESQALAPLAQ